MLTEEILKKIYPDSMFTNRMKYLPFLDKWMSHYEINTPLRKQAFLAQIGHESCQLLYSKELASGSAYEGRKDLGNVQAGDGVNYKGRGLIQITGRDNYGRISKAFGVDFLNAPTLLQSPDMAVRSACWFWQQKKLNLLADLGTDEAFVDITKKINGGTNGLEDRKKLYELCKIYIDA